MHEQLSLHSSTHEIQVRISPNHTQRQQDVFRVNERQQTIHRDKMCSESMREDKVLSRITSAQIITASTNTHPNILSLLLSIFK